MMGHFGSITGGLSNRGVEPAFQSVRIESRFPSGKGRNFIRPVAAIGGEAIATTHLGDNNSNSRLTDPVPGDRYRW